MKADAMGGRAGRLRASMRHRATLTEAIYDAGYNSSSRFYSKSAELLGMTPTAYRAGGAGLRIRFAVGQCAYGAILAAASDKGVRSEEHTSELQSLMRLSYAVFCLKKKTPPQTNPNT